MTTSPPLCPSAQPHMTDAVVFGVVTGTPEFPSVRHLERPIPAGDSVLALAAPVKPTEVFRFAAACAGGLCQHFDGANCRLVRRIVEMVPPVIGTPPPCPVRPACRWWQEEGRDACVRCPQVVTDRYGAPEALREAADPS